LKHVVNNDDIVRTTDYFGKWYEAKEQDSTRKSSFEEYRADDGYEPYAEVPEDDASVFIAHALKDSFSKNLVPNLSSFHFMMTRE